MARPKGLSPIYFGSNSSTYPAARIRTVSPHIHISAWIPIITTYQYTPLMEEDERIPTCSAFGVVKRQT